MLQAASPLSGAGESLLHLSGPSASVRQYQPRSCGLVLLGYSPKPYGSREPFGQLLSSLIDNAHVVVIDHAPELDRAALQVPSTVERSTISVHFASRCFYIPHPSN
ncbi:hypothetical protein [Mesorhizobium sp.]|uniref:hypothetical protein n=1 Tax=Mesorhizobium sp. TaxID=1871066 RepID=UPI00122B04E1|nr:hypothetical protein [Mesorhizobium sp.]TIO06194.1 MAG: hypothetical protein E5X88_23975 [Mesorhizobium sp.]TIO36111.1 MAG: hypothetical protein E5X89_04775 [Mesorhizobium sp.]TIP11111.1 MAG: hypothetical protein E5X73_18145 [Mesorhizobium sp.]